MMSENRRNRRKDKNIRYQKKNNISRKDKIIGVLTIIIIFILATVAAYYYSLSKAGMTLF